MSDSSWKILILKLTKIRSDFIMMTPANFGCHLCRIAQLCRPHDHCKNFTQTENCLSYLNQLEIFEMEIVAMFRLRMGERDSRAVKQQ
jgi:hypothetical protein